MRADPLFATEPLVRATFVDRPNRFLVRYRRAGRQGVGYLANSGRLGEILLPGTEVLLAERRHTKIGREVLGAAWSRRWPGDRPRAVLLNSSRANDVAERLLAARLIPELAAWRVARREVAVGASRFDFLLAGAGGEYLLEVKSVTLAERGLAMFPDATSARGRRHLEELVHLAGRGGRRAGVLFLVQGAADRFLPDFHNDLAFARAFHAARGRVDLLPYRLDPRLDRAGRLVFAGRPRRLAIPWAALDDAVADGGLYLLVLHLPVDTRVAVGALGRRTYPRGWHVYVGSARRGLTHRVARHLRHRKRLHWHIDHLRARSPWVRAFPIRAAAAECALAAEVARLGAGVAPGFGSSDCGCPGHLVWFPQAPVPTAAFQELLTRLRHQPFAR